MLKAIMKFDYPITQWNWNEFIIPVNGEENEPSLDVYSA